MIYTFFTSDLCSINHYIFKTFKYRYLIKFLRKSRKKTINNPEIQNLKKWFYYYLKSNLQNHISIKKYLFPQLSFSE